MKQVNVYMMIKILNTHIELKPHYSVKRVQNHVQMVNTKSGGTVVMVQIGHLLCLLSQ